MSDYLLLTKATKRARNSIDAIGKRLQALELAKAACLASGNSRERPKPACLESAEGGADPDRERDAAVVGRRRKRSRHPDAVREALERDLRELRRSVNDREMEAAVRAQVPQKRGLSRAPKQQTSRSGVYRRGGGEGGVDAGKLVYDADRSLWGERRPGSNGLRTLPSFEDSVLNRAADIFRVPGLAHFMAVQTERQDVFAGFEALVSAWAPAYGSLAFADAYADCEIDLEVAAALQRGETARAARLIDDLSDETH